MTAEQLCIDFSRQEPPPRRLTRGEALYPHEIERLKASEARTAFRAKLPDDPDKIVGTALALLHDYDAGVRTGDLGQERTAKNHLVAIAEYVYADGCGSHYDAAAEWLMARCAAPDDALPLYGQGFRRRLEIAGVLVDVDHRGLLSGISEMYAVPGQQFPSPMGYRSTGFYPPYEPNGVDIMTYFARRTERSFGGSDGIVTLYEPPFGVQHWRYVDGKFYRASKE